MSTGTGGSGNTGGGTGGPQRGRAIYKLGTHRVRVKDGEGQATYVEVPILSRALRRVGQLLGLDQATAEEIRTAVEHEGGVAYYEKRGSVAADRILIVYEVVQGGKVKTRTIQIPIPAWAPNYRLVSALANKARAAGLALRGLRRHGYLITPPESEDGGESGGGGGTGD